MDEQISALKLATDAAWSATVIVENLISFRVPPVIARGDEFMLKQMREQLEQLRAVFNALPAALDSEGVLPTLRAANEMKSVDHHTYRGRSYTEISCTIVQRLYPDLLRSLFLFKECAEALRGNAETAVTVEQLGKNVQAFQAAVANLDFGDLDHLRVDIETELDRAEPVFRSNQQGNGEKALANNESDKKDDTGKKTKKLRPLTKAANDCIRIHRSSRKSGDNLSMKKVVSDYAEENSESLHVNYANFERSPQRVETRQKDDKKTTRQKVTSCSRL